MPPIPVPIIEPIAFERTSWWFAHCVMEATCCRASAMLAVMSAADAQATAACRSSSAIIAPEAHAMSRSVMCPIEPIERSMAAPMPCISTTSGRACGS